MTKVKEVVVKCAEWALGKCGYTADGRELLDPRPVSVPVGFEKPATLSDVMAQMLRPEVQEELRSRVGMETFEEANDFAVPDDPPIEAPWQDPEFGPGMTRELELRSGQVAQPDFKGAQELVRKANEVLARYNEDGTLKEPKKG